MRRCMTWLLRAAWSGTMDLLWPVSCPVCRQWVQLETPGVVGGGGPLAAPMVHTACLAALPRNQTRCPRPRRWPEPIPVWWAFVDTPRFFDVLHAAKYGHRSELLVPLAREVDVDLGPPPPGGRILTPLPDDASRRAERGFSVTGTIAAVLASRLGGTVRSDLLHRRRVGPAQAKLVTREARQANVAALFGVSCLDQVDPAAELVLVEDQVTTGATLAAAARLLGARGHPVLALALGGAWGSPRQVAA